MTTASSNGSMPAGLMLYSFTYDGTALLHECAHEEAFLLSDVDAARVAKIWRAKRATHALSGRVVYEEVP